MNRAKPSPVMFTLMAAMVVGGWFAVSRVMKSLPASERAFFYDVSAARLFAAARDDLPPIRGVDGPEEDAFRVLVVSTNGRTTDRRTWKIAYLETFTPELKAKMTAARKSGEALAMGRLEVQHHRLLRLPDGPETAWHPMDTPEGEAILSRWTHLGAEGSTPVVVSP